jgi:DNA-binding MarR family transcriptional regulator
MADMDRHAAALDQVLELVVLLNEDMTRSLARIGLTGARAHVLWELHHRGPTTQRVLADALQVSPRNITGLVDGLVETGFVTREPHPGDRRATLVSFTEHGHATAKALAEDHQALARTLFAGMSAARFDGLVGGLGEVLDRLRAELPDPRGGRP